MRSSAVRSIGRPSPKYMPAIPHISHASRRRRPIRQHTEAPREEEDLRPAVTSHMVREHRTDPTDAPARSEWTSRKRRRGATRARPSTRLATDEDIRGSDSLSALPFTVRVTGLIYDCFMFFNELDVLEIRLNVLAEVVDRFVLVEARQTHQRGGKPLHYADNRDRFASFADRIEHVVVDEFPEEATGTWGCENWQRNAIRRGIRDAKIGDTILISDVDEIPRPEFVAAADQRRGVTVSRQLLCSYFLNCVHLQEDGTVKAMWGGTVAYRHDARAESPQRYRELTVLPGREGDRL